RTRAASRPAPRPRPARRSASRRSTIACPPPEQRLGRSKDGLIGAPSVRISSPGVESYENGIESLPPVESTLTFAGVRAVWLAAWLAAATLGCAAPKGAPPAPTTPPAGFERLRAYIHDA